jgi:hypothetical protein
MSGSGVGALPVTAIGLLVAAHVFDYVTFLVMTGRHGLNAELNPIVVALADSVGLPGLTVAKVASVVLLASVVTVLMPHRRKWATMILAIGIAVGIVGGISNIASL